MAPKDTNKSTATTTWDDTLKSKFLLEIITRISPTIPSQVLVDIAAKWGPPHTKGSLAMKLHRMKEQYMKEEGGDDGRAGVTGKVNKRKLGGNGAGEVDKKLKKVKTESEVECGDEEKSD